MMQLLCAHVLGGVCIRILWGFPLCFCVWLALGSLGSLLIGGFLVCFCVWLALGISYAVLIWVIAYRCLSLELLSFDE